MMMMGIHFMEDVPFRDVYIHALVRDAEGKKMSKSKGNVIDPLEVIEKFGTDSFRFTLAALAAQGRDIKLSEERIEGYRHFVNKIWNASRLVLMNLEGEVPVGEDSLTYSLADRWILTRVGQVSEEMSRALDNYLFNEAASACYQFVWHEFCDWYLEMAKEGIYGRDPSVKASSMWVLHKVLMSVLKLVHPFMPFVTEEIWQRLPGTQGSVMVADFPGSADFMMDQEALEEMELVMGLIGGIRNIRGEMNIPPSKKVRVVADVPSPAHCDVLRDNVSYIQNLAKVDSVRIESGPSKPKASATAVFGQNQAHVLLEGLIDFEEERNRVGKEIKKIEKEMEGNRRKLSNEAFLEKAPRAVVEQVRERVQKMESKMEKLLRNLEFFESIED
jgi:valyl-tRNA synthetase